MSAPVRPAPGGEGSPISAALPQALAILVVEDDPGDFGLVRVNVRLAKLERGIDSVSWAKSLAEALEQCRRHPPDVVLLDLSLPDSAGLATVQAMRTALPNAPIVVLTGRDDDALVIAALEAGAQDYLIKGRYDHDTLGRVVRHALVREKLETRLRLFEAALNSAANGIVITDVDARVQWANPAFSQLTGFSLDEALGHKPNELIRSGKHDRAFYEHLWETILSGQVWRGEVVNRRKDGTLYDEMLAIAPVFNGAGAIQNFVAIKQDITTHKQEEIQLAESEALNRRMIETANEGIISADAEGRITFVNERLAAMVGYTREEIIGHQHQEYLFPEELDDQQKQIAARQQGRVGTYERRLRCKDGGELRVQVSATPIMDGSGHYAGSFGMITDISERYRAQQKLAERELELRTIIETEPECVKQVASDGTLLHMNRAGLNMIEADSLDQLKGRKVQQLVLPDYRDAFMELTRSVFAGESGNLTFEIQGLKGGHRWLETYAVPLRNAQGRITALLGLTRDITARRQAEVELRIAATAFESQEGIFVTDAAGVILKVNQAFTHITGYSAAEAVGQKSSLTKSGRHDAAFYAAMWKSIQSTGAWQGEIWNRRKNGEVFPEWLTITAVKSGDGETTHYVSTLTDITARKLAEDEIRHLAFYDPLTRLPNRRLLLDRLQQALASSARSGREGALLFIDLDNFKDLNDTLGHDIGDLLLQQVAQRLATCIREGDTVARLGGDEFVVMLEDLSKNPRDAATQTEIVGEKILSVLNQVYQLDGREHQSTPSIGATLFGASKNSVDELLKRADLAMYQAKAAGRNTLRFFDPEMQAVVAARTALEADLRAGLLADQLLLFYQAQVDTTGRLIGAESLVRWQHPQRGMVSPVEFIPLAEDTGLILPIGQWVLTTACTQLVAWAARPETAHLSLAVNVSARQFHHANFVAHVLSVLEQSGANPHKLKLELTESMLVHDIEDIIVKMAALKEIGVRFSLDDFGTGYSSLSYLKRLPLDQLKIDQSFVRNVCSEINDGAIAQAIIALSQTMGLSVIAEGVETEEQRDFLARLGCQAYQGYLFSRPLPAAEFEQLLNRLR